MLNVLLVLAIKMNTLEVNVSRPFGDVTLKPKYQFRIRMFEYGYIIEVNIHVYKLLQ